MAVHNAGELRQRITLQKPGPPVYDKHGYEVPVWETVREVWALARDVSGKEFFEAHANQALSVVTFEIRAQPDLEPDTGWTVLFGGRRYEVLHINHRDHKGQWLEIKAQRVAAERGG